MSVFLPPCYMEMRVGYFRRKSEVEQNGDKQCLWLKRKEGSRTSGVINKREMNKKMISPNSVIDTRHWFWSHKKEKGSNHKTICVETEQEKFSELHWCKSEWTGFSFYFFYLFIFVVSHKKLHKMQNFRSCLWMSRCTA